MIEVSAEIEKLFGSSICISALYLITLFTFVHDTKSSVQKYLEEKCYGANLFEGTDNRFFSSVSSLSKVKGHHLKHPNSKRFCR